MSKDSDEWFGEKPSATATEDEANVETYYHPGATGGEIDPPMADVSPPMNVEPFEAASAGYGYGEETPDEIYAFEESSGYDQAVPGQTGEKDEAVIETYIDETGLVQDGEYYYEEVEVDDDDDSAEYEYYEIEEVEPGDDTPVSDGNASNESVIEPAADASAAPPEQKPISEPTPAEPKAGVSLISEPTPEAQAAATAGFGSLLKEQQYKDEAVVSDPAPKASAASSGKFSPIPELDAEPLPAKGAKEAFVPKPVADREMLLQTNQLVKVYDGRAVVNGVDINVRPGEIVGLLGPNGAGKTTTFYMIVGLVPPNGGAVDFNGNDVTRMPMYQRARLGMGYLPQEESIFRKLTVEQNIMAVMETLNLSRAERRERTHALMERFGITHISQNTALQCSGGEKRRLTIARSLVTQPNLLMLDEPFSGVDPIAVSEIQKIVTDLRESGLAILITDHNVRETLQIVDRAYLIFEGKVLREGTQDFLINDPMSRKLYLGENFNM